jgi:glycosyltransferase involved in cell wall biosynthesis
MIFSIIIPTYNRLDKLKKTLKSIENQSFNRGDFEVVVVNDGSTDKEYKKFRGLSNLYKRLDLKLFEQENFGAGIARNKGVIKSKGEYIIFVGDDTSLSKNFLKEHYDFLKKYPNDCILGFVDWDKGLELNDVMKVVAPFGHQFDYRIKNKLDCGYRHFYTSNISMKREIIKNCLFREDFVGCNWEDIDVGYRLSKKGVKIIFNPNAVCYHDHYYDEETFKKRQRSVGLNKKIFLRLNPELKSIYSNRIFLWFFLYKLYFEIKIFKFLGIREKYLKAVFDLEAKKSFLAS